MNYIIQLKKFRIVAKYEKLSTNAVALYFELFSLFNEDKFPFLKKIANSLIFENTSLSRKQLERARNELISHNLIKYATTNSKSAGTYSLNDLLEKDYTTATNQTKIKNKLRQIEQLNCDKSNKDLVIPPTTPIIMNKTIKKDSIYTLSNYNNMDEIPKEYWDESQLSFKKEFPDKLINAISNKNCNINLLIQKINFSNFLKKNKRFDFCWCMKNYKKILNGYYDDYKEKNNEIQYSEKENFIKHDYSNFRFDSLFDDLDSLKL